MEQIALKKMGKHFPIKILFQKKYLVTEAQLHV